MPRAVTRLGLKNDQTLYDLASGQELSGGDGAAKAWAFIAYDGSGVPSISDSMGVTSIADAGTGDIIITWEVPFASTTYAVLATVATGGTLFALVSNITTTTTRVLMADAAGTLTDPSIGLMVAAFGAQ